jgi:hypothetical protein
MTLLNVVGISRFIQLGPMALAVGVLPYPLTFLCTDFISVFYGRRRANFVVWVGFALNLIVLGFLWLGHQMPPVSEAARPDWLPRDSWQPPPWQTLRLAAPMALPWGGEASEIELFEVIYRCTWSTVLASMLAYLAAQLCDVALFHFWKKRTRGKHLWLRNNGSTMISQLVDATAVIFITFWGQFISGERTLGGMLTLVGSNYMFKFAIAAADTVPFYAGVYALKHYLAIDPTQEHDADAEEARAKVGT